MNRQELQAALQQRLAEPTRTMTRDEAIDLIARFLDFVVVGPIHAVENYTDAERLVDAPVAVALGIK